MEQKCGVAIPWTAACQASLSFTISQSLLKLVSIESVMPSNHLILCRPLLLPSIISSIRRKAGIQVQQEAGEETGVNWSKEATRHKVCDQMVMALATVLTCEQEGIALGSSKDWTRWGSPPESQGRPWLSDSLIQLYLSGAYYVQSWYHHPLESSPDLPQSHQSWGHAHVARVNFHLPPHWTTGARGWDVAAAPTSASPLPKTMISSLESLKVVEQVHWLNCYYFLMETSS